MIHIYYGDGKGKTTASLGLALRASGFKKKTIIVQFLKPKELSSGEVKAVAGNPFIKIIRFREFSHPDFRKIDFKKKQKIREKIIDTLTRIRRDRKKYNIIILDEVLNALEAKFIDEKFLREFLKSLEQKEIVITGRKLRRGLSRFADYISLIKEIKHPFQRGIRARRGIEY